MDDGLNALWIKLFLFSKIIFYNIAIQNRLLYEGWGTSLRCIKLLCIKFVAFFMMWRAQRAALCTAAACCRK